MSKNFSIIKKIVKNLGGEIKEIDKKREIIEIAYKNKKFLICRKFGIGTDVLSHTAFTKFKDVTCKLLSRRGIKIPRTLVVEKNTPLLKILEGVKRINAPYIVKNLSGSNSKGIFPNIKNEEQLIKTLKRELPKYEKMMVQEVILGKEYRLLFLGGRIIAALNMIPPFIVGDGKNNVRILIENKQKKSRKKIIIDSKLKELLEMQGTKLDNVLNKGKIIYIKGYSSISEGGIMIDVTEKVHPSFDKICKKAAEAVKLELAGIDLICTNIEVEASQQDYAILEINGKPDVYIHYEPERGKKRDVVSDIIEYIIKII